MDKEAIKKILPHREPMLLVDEAFCEEGLAQGSYTVRGDEFFLQGHFPDNPVVPGVIICEMMGQSACLLIDFEGDFIPYFTGMNKVKFRRVVVPGDTIEFKSRLLRRRMNVYVIECEGRVDGDLCVSGELSFFIAGDGAN